MSPFRRIFVPFEYDVNFVSMQTFVTLTLTPDAMTSTISLVNRFFLSVPSLLNLANAGTDHSQCNKVTSMEL